jgi:hypothetical protein
MEHADGKREVEYLPDRRMREVRLHDVNVLELTGVRKRSVHRVTQIE